MIVAGFTIARTSTQRDQTRERTTPEGAVDGVQTGSPAESEHSELLAQRVMAK